MAPSDPLSVSALLQENALLKARLSELEREQAWSDALAGRGPSSSSEPRTFPLDLSAPVTAPTVATPEEKRTSTAVVPPTPPLTRRSFPKPEPFTKENP